MVHSGFRRGFVKRHPTVVSAVSGALRLHGSPDLSITYGARVMVSTPPALIGMAARSSARTDARLPPCLPTGVRRAAKMYTLLTGPPTRNAERGMRNSPADRREAGPPVPRSAFRLPRSQSHPDGLELRIIVQRLAPQVAPESRELVAAERRRGVVEVVRVHPHGPRLDRASHAVRFLDIPGPDPGREAVQRAVAELDALGFVLERQHRQNGTENLLVDDLHPWLGVVEHRGLDVEPLAVHLRGFAAGHQPGAFLLPGRDIGEHRLLLALGDDRPQPGGLVERVAGRDLLGPLGELRHDLIMDRAFHQEPGAGALL